MKILKNLINEKKYEETINYLYLFKLLCKILIKYSINKYEKTNNQLLTNEDVKKTNFIGTKIYFNFFLAIFIDEIKFNYHFPWPISCNNFN